MAAFGSPKTRGRRKPPLRRCPKCRRLHRAWQDFTVCRACKREELRIPIQEGYSIREMLRRRRGEEAAAPEAPAASGHPQDDGIPY